MVRSAHFGSSSQAWVRESKRGRKAPVFRAPLNRGKSTPHGGALSYEHQLSSNKVAHSLIHPAFPCARDIYGPMGVRQAMMPRRVVVPRDGTLTYRDLSRFFLYFIFRKCPGKASILIF